MNEAIIFLYFGFIFVNKKYKLTIKSHINIYVLLSNYSFFLLYNDQKQDSIQNIMEILSSVFQYIY